MLRRDRLRLSLALTVPMIAAALGCSPESREAGLLLSVTTDMAVPASVREIGIVVRGADTGTVYFARRWPVVAGAVELPASLGIRHPENAERILVSAVAYRQSLQGALEPFVLREALTSVPTTRVAVLPLPLEWIGWGSAVAVKPLTPAAPDAPSTQSIGATLALLGGVREGVAIDPASEFARTCAAGTTSVAGSCIRAEIQEDRLPDAPAAGSQPETRSCFDPVACFSGGKPMLLATAHERPGDPTSPCLATPPTPFSAQDTFLNVALRARDGSGWVWHVQDRAATDPVGAAEEARADLYTGVPPVRWSLNAAGQVVLPASICERIEEDRRAVDAFARTEGASIPERGTVGVYAMTTCDSVKSRILNGCVNAAPGTARVGSNAQPALVGDGTGPTGPGATINGKFFTNPLYGTQNIDASETVRTAQPRELFGCSEAEKVADLPPGLPVRGLDASTNGVVLLRTAVGTWLLPDGTPLTFSPPTAGIRDGHVVGSGLVAQTDVGARAFALQGATATATTEFLGNTVPSILVPVAYPRSALDFRTLDVGANASIRLPDGKRTWRVTDGDLPLFGALGAANARPVIAGNATTLESRQLVNVKNPTATARAAFRGVALDAKGLWAQDGDHLAKFPVTDATVNFDAREEVAHAVPTLADDLPFELVEGDLIAATRGHGILVRPSVGAAQLCVPYWRHNGQTALPEITGFAIGRSAEGNTYAYWTEENAGKPKLFRVELLYR
jgi:hypothetical protein